MERGYLVKLTNIADTKHSLFALLRDDLSSDYMETNIESIAKKYYADQVFSSVPLGDTSDSPIVLPGDTKPDALVYGSGYIVPCRLYSVDSLMYHVNPINNEDVTKFEQELRVLASGNFKTEDTSGLTEEEKLLKKCVDIMKGE